MTWGLSPRDLSPTTELASKVLVLVVVVGKRFALLEPSIEPLHGAIASYLPRLEHLSRRDH